MLDVNVRGTFVASQACLPHLIEAARRRGDAHIVTLAPPPSLDPKWWRDHVGYSIAKMGMSLCVLGMAEEFRAQGVAVNALWPRTVVATAAVMNLLGGESVIQRSRKPEIMADGAHAILTRPSRECTGNFFIDEEVLASAGVTDFEQYAVKPGERLLPDLFV